MDSYNLYQDIAERTNGDIYIGVVGPVRTGKSTFIKRFMDKLVLPHMDDITRKARVIDELPQSADGKIVMTTQPKFVPDGGVKIDIAENIGVNVRLIDCVGYLIAGVEGESRMVRTPWSDKEMTFEEAAELGTRKVMLEHSTIGVLVTTDGSVTGFERNAYQPAEERIAQELSNYSKPFAIVLNTATPDREETKRLCLSLNEKYCVPVIPKDVASMETEDFCEVLESILYEFPLRMINCDMPRWMQMLRPDNVMIQGITSKVAQAAAKVNKMRDYTLLTQIFDDDEVINKIKNMDVCFGDGSVNIELVAKEGVFYTVLSDECDVDIKDDSTLFNYIKNATFAEKQYNKMKQALNAADEGGYGVVIPADDEVELLEPEFVKSGVKTSVKMRAKASCLHIMKVDVETEVNPIIGNGVQAQEMVKYLQEEYKDNVNGIWETNMFGKTMNTLAKEGLSTKMYSMPPDAQLKLRKTVSRIVNEGKGGVLCVLL